MVFHQKVIQYNSKIGEQALKNSVPIFEKWDNFILPNASLT